MGAGRYERQKYEKLGSEKTLQALLDDDRVDEGFPISPWEFASQEGGTLDTNAYHLGLFWSLRMLLSKRPLEQKLSLFWHDHFAVDFEKVYEMPMLYGYLETIRTKGRGKFKDLLTSLFKQGSLYMFLDQHTSNRIHPNENFARELMELFTLGIGNYTEQDVLESARALTGWSLHYLGTGLNYNYEDLRMMAAKKGMGMNNTCYVPAIHDDGDKTILGVTKKWNADDLLEMLANHPTTAKYISEKLWVYFAGTTPTENVLAKLTQTWKRTDGDIKEILKAIAKMPEFWSDEVVRTRPKCPVDFNIALYRSFDIGSVVLALRGTPKDQYQPIAKPVRDVSGGLYYLMARQGMSLLRPPNVAGWDWGEAWINTTNTVERINMANALFYSGGPDRGIAVLLATKLKTEDKVTTPEGIVDGVADILDVPISTASRPALVEACGKFGGVKALDNKDQAANLFARLCKLMFAVPEFQLC